MAQSRFNVERDQIRREREGNGKVRKERLKERAKGKERKNKDTERNSEDRTN